MFFHVSGARITYCIPDGVKLLLKKRSIMHSGNVILNLQSGLELHRKQALEENEVVHQTEAEAFLRE